jgi:DNA repair exonuclease SbcCD nuclease subunit
MNAVAHVVDRTVEIQADAIVWPGDIFNDPKPPATAVQFVKKQVKRLEDAGVVSIGIDGNHDATDGKWLRVCNINTFDGAYVEIEGVAFAGLNFARPSRCKKQLQELAEQNPRVEVLVLHQPLGDLTAFGCEITAEWIVNTFKDKGLKYVALGDIHNYGTWIIDGVHFVYPGSVEMTDIDEDPGKYFVVVEIDEDVKLYNETTNPRPIAHYELETQEQISNMLEEIESSYGDHVLPVIRVNTDITDGVARIQRELRTRMPYILQRFSQETGLDEQIFDRNWSQVGLVDLISIVEQTHKKDSEEYQLITNMIGNPEQVDEIADTFIEQKGLAELCQT